MEAEADHIIDNVAEDADEIAMLSDEERDDLREKSATEDVYVGCGVN